MNKIFLTEERNRLNLKAKDVVLCGNMFANSILLSKTNKTLSKNYNIILPKEYPLDY